MKSIEMVCPCCGKKIIIDITDGRVDSDTSVFNIASSEISKDNLETVGIEFGTKVGEKNGKS